MVICFVDFAYVLVKNGSLKACYWKLFLRTVFENTDNTIMMLFENCSYSLNILFYVFFMFFQKKEPNVFSMFSLFSLFLRTKTSFKKLLPNRPLISHSNLPLWNQVFAQAVSYYRARLTSKTGAETGLVFILNCKVHQHVLCNNNGIFGIFWTQVIK